VGAAGGLQAEVGIVRRDARRFPDAHSDQIAKQIANAEQQLGHRDGPEARADLHRAEH